MGRIWGAVTGALLGWPMLAMAQPAGPPLPAGLGGAVDPPPLPGGLSVPDVPPGLEAPTPDTAPSPGSASPVTTTGFLDSRLGRRLAGDAHQPDQSLGEVRLSAKATGFWDPLAATLAADLLFDARADRTRPDLRRGAGAIDLREANLAAPVGAGADLKLGRQILTWGTGDLLFLNDLFPKDWNSFFLGRDVAYLKAPVDAAKLSFYTPLANLDLVYVPRFTPDRFIDGRRVSYFSPALGRRAGRDAVIAPDVPGAWLAEDEWGARLYRRFGSLEAALYAYDGYWSTPEGVGGDGRAIYPRLGVYGASLRAPLAGGLINLEGAYYDSRDDRAGDDPLIRNGEWRFLLGYEREIARELTLGLQWYLETMVDADAYRATLPAGQLPKDRDRHVLSARLTWRTLNQDLTWSLFAFVSPSDRDGYLRPRLSWQIDDNWRAEFGGNLFFGDRPETFFGQFDDNANVFTALRYSF